tara:strand:- start:147 stop:929 length:783 start_codon:yes stop_codon:yes gene_type:complete
MKLFYLPVYLFLFLGLILGMLFQKYKPFPYDLLITSANWITEEARIAGEFKSGYICPVVYDKKLYRIQDISEEEVQIRKIFWGDSVVSDMHDGRFYGMDSYQEIGFGGQVIYCALQEIQLLLNFSPKMVVIYIGGNDADGQSWYGSEQAALYYSEIIDILLENNIIPIVHLVHEASLTRDRNYVKDLNNRLRQLASERSLKVIPDMKELSFSRLNVEVSNNLDYHCKEANCSGYSYDGEHLKHDGYKAWIEHIKKYIPDF